MFISSVNLAERDLARPLLVLFFFPLFFCEKMIIPVLSERNVKYYFDIAVIVCCIVKAYP